MSEFKVTVSGLDGFEQRLRDEPKKLALRVLRRAGRDAAKVWQDAIEQLAPALTGFLKTHIDVASTTKGDASLTVMVGPDKKAFYGMMQEFGTRYQRAKPFMRPAYENSKQQVLDVFTSDVKDELDSLKE